MFVHHVIRKDDGRDYAEQEQGGEEWNNNRVVIGSQERGRFTLRVF
jgi:hypothetical protein